MTDSAQNRKRLRLLVAIASYGEKNIEFLRRTIQNYRGMAMDVDVVVVSEAPKDLGPSVRVVVGLPSKNPWSLPFAHKPVLAENVDKYDLFAYSEDDMGVTEANIEAFARVTPHLKEDEIAGFLRYEVDSSGATALPDVFGPFHWNPESVAKRGPYTIARFTNEHAAFYLLTQAQLRRAIASGGFLREPREGRYEMLETAATDPYTSCGFHKVICISALGDFLIHHQSNRYMGRVGVGLSVVREQVRTLMTIAEGSHPASTLCEVEARVWHFWWSKSYYEAPSEELMRMVPSDAKSVLSIGCGWGELESRLVRRGAEVTALPLDSVVGASAARYGVNVVYGTLDEGLRSLKGRKFDCVVVSDLLHLLPNPWAWLECFGGLVSRGGVLVAAGPHFDSLLVRIKRAFGLKGCQRLADFSAGRVNAFGVSTLARRLRRLGFLVSSVEFSGPNEGTRRAALRRRLGRFGAENWSLQARAV
ncbi:MAG: class I SAM-dependent methyltransferase [Limisphaerales bacterium]